MNALSAPDRTLPSADRSVGQPPAKRRGWLHPTTLFALALAAAVNLGAWWAMNRPVAVPDFTGTVGGLAFSPYHRGQSAETESWPTAAQIRSDLELAASITGQIRTYAVHGGLERIPALAEDLPLSITLGSWLDRRLDRNAAEITRLISVARASPNVDRIMVGNEAVLRTDLTPAQLASYMRQVRAAVPGRPVSTAEPWHVWLDHPELAQAVDFITVHLLPYWEGLPVQDALRFAFEKLDAIQARFPGKKIVIGEIGWPSDGRDTGAARANRVNQADFMRRFFIEAEKRGLDYFVMEAFDQPWKTSFEGRAAGYWGMYDLDRAPKWPLTGQVQETPGWVGWAAGASLAALLFAGALLSRRPDIKIQGKLVMAVLTQLFCATLAAVLLSMSEKYLSGWAAGVWGVLIAGQVLLLVLLLADTFELAETVWGRAWRRRAMPAPAPEGTKLPKVSIHIPICNEPPHMVRQTLDALAALDYPDFEVLVIDNNTKDPALWEPVAEHCARLGSRFRFFTLGKWPGFKAGALNFALRETAPDAEVIGVLDSDYTVTPDWLRCMAPFFNDPKVGFVQSPQDYRDNDGSIFKRLMFWEYAGFFKLGMVTRNERNAIIQHGTMTLVRKEAMAQVNGWSEWTICEDAELGLKLFRNGWEAVYSPRSFGRGVMPDDFAAFRKQRFRWAYGAMQIMRGHARALFNPFNRSLTLGQRWSFVMGWLPWIGDALGLVFLAGGLAWSVGLIVAPMRFEFPILLFMVPSIGLFVFKLAQLLTLYKARVDAPFIDRLGAALGGLSLTHAIGKAVLKGLVVRSAPFLRTPKMENAPALVQGLVMAREELVILTLTWAAMIGVAIAHRFGTWEATLWVAVLFTQSLPYLASVAVSVIAAMPARQEAPRPLPVPAGARIAAGD